MAKYLLICGDNFFKAFDFKNAITVYHQIIELNLDYDYKIYGLGNLNNELGDYDENAYLWY